MPNKVFRFKKFEVRHDKCAMKVGTDGVLLGAWTDCDKGKHILDIGTGTGLIALMLAQRFPQANITTIDIVEDAALQAAENFSLSPWNDRLSANCTSLQEFSTPRSFDCIVANPPFFQNAYLSESESRNTARHTDTLSLQDLAQGIDRLLSPTGTANVVFPMETIAKFEEICAPLDLHPTKRCEVIPTTGKPPKRCLLEFSRGQGDIDIQSIVLEKGVRHAWSEEYKALTKDFYLAL